jgi:SAM-dependent methyltransferase
MTSAATRRLLKQHQGIRLDVGCGDRKQKGYIGIDQRRVPGVDIVHDITKTPWPLPESCAMVVVLTHVWEHIHPTRTLDVMAEIHRVSRDDGIVMMSGPYGLGNRFVQDPTHCNPSNEATFMYWDKLHPSRLWEVYKPPVLHLEAFEMVPANGDRDFEVALRVCKGRCHHGR